MKIEACPGSFFQVRTLRGIQTAHGLFTIYHLRFTMLLMSVPFIEENDQTRARQEHLEALRQLVGNVYPNKFERSHVIDPQREDTITSMVEKYRAFEPEAAEGERPAP